MKRFFAAFAGGFLSLMIVSCTGEKVDYSEPPVLPPAVIPPEVTELPTDLPDVTTPDEATAPLSAIPSETIAKLNEFSLKFYLANSEGGNKNVCVSPFSVGAVLGMIANGDDGAARDGILKVLGLEEGQAGLDALNAYYQTLLSNLPNIEEGITCNLTNTLWCAMFGIRKSFMDVISDYYYAYGIGISPSGESGRKAINEFVGKNTNGLINEFLKEPLTEELAFLNTLYFKAGWTFGFIEDYKDRRTFVDIDGNEQEVDFMLRDNWTRYAVTEDGTEAIRMDYGENEQFSMTCILPSSKINHMALDEVLTVENFNNLNKNMQYESIDVFFPEFEIENNNPNTLYILTSMGLNETAPFGLITDNGGFSLTSFIHATKIKVDQNGTEGAAVSLGALSSGFHPAPVIVFDRPFIFYIQENTTGAILFIGSVKTFS